jgi:hypothetical protein
MQLCSRCAVHARRDLATPVVRPHAVERDRRHHSTPRVSGCGTLTGGMRCACSCLKVVRKNSAAAAHARFTRAFAPRQVLDLLDCASRNDSTYRLNVVRFECFARLSSDRGRRFCTTFAVSLIDPFEWRASPNSEPLPAESHPAHQWRFYSQAPCIRWPSCGPIPRPQPFAPPRKTVTVTS